MYQSTINGGATLSDALNQLSLSAATATALQPSSPTAPSLTADEVYKAARTPRSGSIGGNERSTTPTLRKRTSLGSLRAAAGSTSPRSPAFRRTSSALAASPSGTNMGARSSLPPPAEEVPQPTATAASIAHDNFKQELQMHDDGVGAVKDAQTVVILQDDCYGHRYSRPRTSRATLSTIVERPERIHASILGLAAAYVRIGGRHAEGRAGLDSKRHMSSITAVPFRIQKTSRRMSLRSPAATSIHDMKWMTELSAMCDAAESRLALGGKELTRPNMNNNASQVESPKLHEGDLYLCSGSLNALEGALGGVCEGVDAVFKEEGAKRAFVCIRPPGHHCSADMPSGFCWLNNVHVGIGHAALNHGLTHAAIIDFDLHHGDGSQSITWDHNARMSALPKNTPISKKTAIGYFSLHDINSYPCEMGDEEKVRSASLCMENAHGQTIWNIHLQPWKTEAEFWQLYQDRYSVILSKARNFLRLHSDRLRQAPTHPKAKAAIFLSAGFDASEWESEGMQRHHANVPTDFYSRFTRDIVMMAEEESLGVDGRVISVLEGGYSDRALMSGVFSHISGLTPTSNPSAGRIVSTGLNHEINSRMGDRDLQNTADVPRESVEAVSNTWWSPSQLEEIESLISLRQSTTAPKKQRNDPRPAYTSATQSYTAKIVSPPQFRRSLSGNGAYKYATSSPGSRGASPPPPAVDWATAAHELSKLLVPSDRETRSCKPEDLNAEATRARRDRQSTAELLVDGPVNELKRMQLRDRKTKPTKYISDDQQEKSMSRAHRRKTIADVSLISQTVDLPIVGHDSATQPVQRMRRRSSVASSAGSMHAEKGSDFSLGSKSDNQPGREQNVVKKTRAAANLRTDNAKSKAVRKQSGSSVASRTTGHSAPTQAPREENKVPLTENEELKNQDVDKLVSGMTQMKIKLNVPPKDEYEARQKLSKPAPRGRPKSAIARPTDAASPSKARTKAVKVPPATIAKETLPSAQLPQPCPVPGAVQGTPMPAPAPVLPELQPATLESLHSASPSLAVTPSATVPSLAPDVQGTEAFSNPTPSTEIEASIAAPQPAQSPSFPIDAAPSTPITAKRTRQDLPVFTSTSSISFSSPSRKNPNFGQPMIQDSNGQALSEMRTPGQQPILSAPGQSALNSASGPTAEINTKEESTSQSSDSIWDVPDTPQPRKP